MQKPTMDLQQIKSGVYIGRVKLWGLSEIGEAEFELEPKPTLVLGRMGAGKTSLAKAVEFGLVGDTQIVQDNVTSKSSGVELELKVINREAKTILVRRLVKLERGKIAVKSELLEDGELVAEGEEVNRLLASLCNEKSVESFREVFILRGEMEKSSRLLREYVESLAGVKLLEAVRGKIEKYAMQMDSQLLELERGLEEFEVHFKGREELSAPSGGGVEEKLNSLNRRFKQLIASVQREKEQYLEKKKSKEGELEKLNFEAEQLEKLREKLESVSQSVAIWEEKASVSEQNLINARFQERRVREEIAELETSLANLEKRLSEDRKEMETLRSQVEEMEGELKKGEAEPEIGVDDFAARDRLERIIRNIEENIRETRSQLTQEEDTLQYELKNLDEAKQKYQILRGKEKRLPESPSSVEDLLEIRFDVENALNYYRPRTQALEEQVNLFKSLLKYVEKRGCPLCHRGAQQLKGEIVLFAKTLKELESERQNIEGMMVSEEARLKIVDEAIKVFKTLENIKGSVSMLEGVVARHREELNRYEKNLEVERGRLALVEERIRGKRDWRTEQEKKLVQLREKMSSLAGRIEDEERRLEATRGGLEKKKKLLGDVEKTLKNAELDRQEKNAKLQELRSELSKLEEQNIRSQIRVVQSKISRCQSDILNIEKQIKNLESSMERYEYAVSTLREREKRIRQVREYRDTAEKLVAIMEWRENDIQREINEKLTKQLMSVDRLVGLKSINYESGVVSRETERWSGEQNIHTLSDAEYVATLAFVATVFGAFKGEIRKRFMWLDVQVDSKSRIEIAKILIENNCTQPIFLVSEEGELQIQPLKVT